MIQIFISYSRKDLKFVEGLAADLKHAGFEVWYDYLRLRGGERWRIEIQNALKASQCVITVLSPDSVVSEWVEREFLFASSLDRRIIPLLLRDCELPLNYMDLNYIDVRGENYRRNFNKILEVLKADRATYSPHITSRAQIHPPASYAQTSPGSLLRPSLSNIWIPTLVLLICLTLSAAVAGYQFWLRPELLASDGDRDGLTYAEEIEYGCNPNKQDSDNDGLIDVHEKQWQTYCERSDSDNDGLSDSEEIFVRNTDPVKADTDGDGIIDSQDQAPPEMPTATAGLPTSEWITQTFTTEPSTPIPETPRPSIPTLTPTHTQPPTHTPTLTYTTTPTNTQSPTATNFPIDLYALASNALWTSRAGNLIFGGPDTDARGFAMYKNGVRLEDGTIPAKVLYTHPEWVDDGYIIGVFPSQRISTGGHFRTQIGFLANPDGSCSIGNVKFQLWYKESGSQLFFSLGSWTKSCDGRLQNIDVSVNSLAGKNVQFVLQVLANGVSWDDWAVWVNPRIEY